MDFAPTAALALTCRAAGFVGNEEVRFPLYNGQTKAVKSNLGLCGETGGLPKSPREYKGCTRDRQARNTGATPEQHADSATLLPSSICHLPSLGTPSLANAITSRLRCPAAAVIL
jgi:hypothetical protein